MEGEGFVSTFQRHRGKIPVRRCISLLFRTYRKDLGNHFGIVRFKEARESLGNGYPVRNVAMHTLWRGCILIRGQGFLSEVCPLGKCIRVATPFIMSFLLPLFCITILFSIIIKTDGAMGYNRQIFKMKKVIILAFGAMLLASCGSSKSWHKGQAEWMRVPIHENFDYNKAFATAIDLLSEKYEMEMINKDGGYARTATNYYRKKSGRTDEKKRVRVTLKFNHDRTQLSVKTEVQKYKKGDWIDGYDTKLGRQTRDDLQGVLQ